MTQSTPPARPAALHTILLIAILCAALGALGFSVAAWRAADGAAWSADQASAEARVARDQAERAALGADYAACLALPERPAPCTPPPAAALVYPRNPE